MQDRRGTSEPIGTGLDDLISVGEALGALERSLATSHASLDRLAVDEQVRADLVAAFAPTVLVVWQAVDAGASWVPRLAEGRPTAPRVPTAALPRHVLAALTGGRAEVVADLGETPHPRTAAALAAPLHLPDGSLVGLVSVEHPAPGRYSARDAELLEALAARHALLIDNARRVARLQLEVDASTYLRVQRETQDRLGQWLSYVALELEAVLRETTSERLLELYRDVHAALEEARDALRGTANDVRHGRPFSIAARELLDRFEERTDIETNLEVVEGGAPLPVATEQRILAILREAVRNTERHADAASVDVHWQVDDTGATLEVVDDGVGFELGRSVRDRSRGFIQMYDHADAIRADLAVQSARGRGTTVVLRADRDSTSLKGDDRC